MSEITMGELRALYLTAHQIIAGTGISHRQIDHWRRRGYIEPSHAMFTSFDQAKPVRVWAIEDTKEHVFSGAKILFRKDDIRTWFAQNLIRLVDAGLDVPVALALTHGLVHEVREQDREIVDVLIKTCDAVHARERSRRVAASGWVDPDVWADLDD